MNHWGRIAGVTVASLALACSAAQQPDAGNRPWYERSLVGLEVGPTGDNSAAAIQRTLVIAPSSTAPRSFVSASRPTPSTW